MASQGQTQRNEQAKVLQTPIPLKNQHTNKHFNYTRTSTLSLHTLQTLQPLPSLSVGPSRRGGESRVPSAQEQIGGVLGEVNALKGTLRRDQWISVDL